MSVPSDAELLRRAYEEVQRLRAELARVTPECGGCLHQGGPLEECPLHGREYAYWVDGCTELSEQVGRLRAELADAQAVSTRRSDDLKAYASRAWEAEAAIARVRELCASPIDERVWSHRVYAAVLRALNPAGEPPPSG